ncbi:MAG: CpsB/CapC family capsule biosynthesis tyrosine phosphatase [Thermodesulfobacteriota bacterium]|nr:CpsB/CapC family capsule biosynthesis tyrosine phosphatase [Thermodesulfobacteriota bacterium]
MIDLHCHILPGVDDGSRSLKESLAMAQMAVRDGIHTIVATAHTLNGIYVNPINKVVSWAHALEKAFAKNGISLRLFAGSEVHICPHMVEQIKKGTAGTINRGGKYLLLELPSQSIPGGVKEEIFSLKLNGITPIIAHPERNALIRRDSNILYELIGMGALSQVTAMSVTGGFGVAVRQSAETLLRQRMCHVIASDAHSAVARPPVLSEAVEDAADILGSYEEAARMVTDVPAAIVSGRVPEIAEPRPARSRVPFYKRWFKKS